MEDSQSKSLSRGRQSRPRRAGSRAVRMATVPEKAARGNREDDNQRESAFLVTVESFIWHLCEPNTRTHTHTQSSRKMPLCLVVLYPSFYLFFPSFLPLFLIFIIVNFCSTCPLGLVLEITTRSSLDDRNNCSSLWILPQTCSTATS